MFRELRQKRLQMARQLVADERRKPKIIRRKVHVVIAEREKKLSKVDWIFL